jgi:hypothetical protein
VALVNTTLLDAEEHHVFKKILKAQNREKRQNLIGSYSFIKYKLTKLKKKQKLVQIIKSKNSYKILREKHLTRLRRLYGHKYTLSSLCQNIQDTLSEEYSSQKSVHSKKFDSLIQSFQPLSDNTEKQVQLFKTCKSNTFRLINLSLMMMSLGNEFEVPCKPIYLLFI